jgi:hypothetical protein
MMQNLITQILPEGPTTRDKVFLAEKLMKEMPQEVKRELKVEHDFSLGVYARILYIPADTILVGKLHKYPQINLIRQGDLSVLVGDKVKRLKAPFVVASPAGTKRIAYVHRDTVWVTVHGTNLKDVDEIEKFFIAQDEQEYLEFLNDQRRKDLYLV